MLAFFCIACYAMTVGGFDSRPEAHTQAREGYNPAFAESTSGYTQFGQHGYACWREGRGSYLTPPSLQKRIMMRIL